MTRILTALEGSRGLVCTKAATCPSRIRCQAATGSWTKSRQWETQRTLFSSALATMWPPAKVDGVWPFNDAWRCCMKPLAGEVVWPALLLTLCSQWLQPPDGAR